MSSDNEAHYYTFLHISVTFCLKHQNILLSSVLKCSPSLFFLTVRYQASYPHKITLQFCIFKFVDSNTEHGNINDSEWNNSKLSRIQSPINFTDNVI